MNMKRLHSCIFAIFVISFLLLGTSRAGRHGVADIPHERISQEGALRRLLDEGGTSDSESELPDKKCACIFDFDGTIWLGKKGKKGGKKEGSIAKDSLDVIQKCKDEGYGVAIASASPEDMLKTILQQQDNNDIFNEDFFESGAFQTGNLVKSTELNAILNHFNIEDPGCAIFFDDEVINQVFSILTGVTHHNVDESEGVTMADLEEAWRAMPQECGCPDVTH